MLLATAVKLLEAGSIVPASDEGAELTGCFAADLMSDVLAFASQGSLLVTGLATDQAIRTAAIKQLLAVVVVQGKRTDDEMLEVAREEGVGLYRTELSKYEACGRLVQSGLGPCHRAVPRPTERN